MIIARPVTQSREQDGETRAAPAAAGQAPSSAKVVRGALVLLSTQPITWAASLAAVVLLPRYLGDRGLGQYGTATSLAHLVGVVAGLGVPRFLIRRVATQSARTLIDVGGALVLVVAAGLLATLG